MPKILKKRNVSQSVLELALERLHHAFDLYDTVDVSFSGGKDSTACLNLALHVARERKRLPLRVFFHDEEAIPLQTADYAQRVSMEPDIAFEWYCLPVQHRNACSRLHPYWSPWDPNEQEKWVRPLPQKAITHLKGFHTDGEPRDRMTIPQLNGLLHDPKKYGTCGMIMGIRGQESMTRQRAVSHRTEENYLIPYTDITSKGNIWKVYPIYDWQTEDVWTAPKIFGWDYNAAYDVMDKLGIPASQQRCSPTYGEEPMQGFHQFKTCFPEVWDKMSIRVPGANTALYYARTELYGYKGNPEKPDDMSWEDFILHYIEKFAGPEAPLVAENVRKSIARHYNKTSDPILEDVRHPDTGLAWKLLLNISMRGDFKGRRTQGISTKMARPNDIEAYAKAWEMYNDARRQEGK